MIPVCLRVWNDLISSGEANTMDDSVQRCALIPFTLNTNRICLDLWKQSSMTCVCSAMSVNLCVCLWLTGHSSLSHSLVSEWRLSLFTCTPNCSRDCVWYSWAVIHAQPLAHEGDHIFFYFPIFCRTGQCREPETDHWSGFRSFFFCLELYRIVGCP